ncbi:MAG: lytic transglycosylase domain-containing protein [Saprospiraceae bacterium]|nr:lytic transglycosylase domain-containing protein [Saprospiraceae bacterium]
MKNIGKLSFFVVILCLVAASFTFFSYSDKSNNIVESIPQKIIGIKLFSKMEFAGEEVPVKNPDVAERLERELIINTYQHTSTLLHLKLANRYLPTVEKVFREEGVPDDLKYLAVAESSLRNAVSSAGAKGIWQFRDAAAKDFGLLVSEYVDERNHFEKSTRAACKYLKQLKERFGTWSLACAAYNMGPTALATSLKEQEENSYYDLNLNDETNRYLFRIIAIKEIMKNPDRFGYFLSDSDYYITHSKSRELKIDTSISNLSRFAHSQGITYRLLKVYNPWLLKSSLPNSSRQTFIFRIPEE